MLFVQTFKGYEDKTAELDSALNEWVLDRHADVVSVETVLSHEPGARSGSGDLLYTVVYRAEAPLT